MIKYEILQDLYVLQEDEFQLFQQKSIPNIPKESIIGVRTRHLRALAKKYKAHPEIDLFLTSLPHTYYEENMIHAFILSGWDDYDKCVSYVEEFLPFIDNWSTCDLPSMQSFSNHLSDLENRIHTWITAKHSYTIRFAIVTLMKLYLEEDTFLPKYLKWVSMVQSEDYYVKMSVAWYFATALAKQYEATIPYIEGHMLQQEIHKKTIQKAVESYRLTDDVKSYLKTLR